MSPREQLSICGSLGNTKGSHVPAVHCFSTVYLEICAQCRRTSTPDSARPSSAPTILSELIHVHKLEQQHDTTSILAVRNSWRASCGNVAGLHAYSGRPFIALPFQAVARRHRRLAISSTSDPSQEGGLEYIKSPSSPSASTPGAFEYNTIRLADAFPSLEPSQLASAIIFQTLIHMPQTLVIVKMMLLITNCRKKQSTVALCHPFTKTRRVRASAYLDL
jgi:hypothetical protein